MAKVVLLTENDQLIFPQTHISAVSGKASLQLAIDGVDNITYMTPNMTKIAIEKNTSSTILYQYSVDGVSNWHENKADNDKYYRMSIDNGLTWGPAFKIVGENGVYSKHMYTCSGFMDTPKWNELNNPSLDLSNQWTLDLPVPPLGTYIWGTFRTYRDGSPVENSQWCMPFIMQGQKGDDGEDGQGYEYCFTKRPITNPLPGIFHKPDEDLSADDYCPYVDELFTTKWTDNPTGPDPINNVEYIILRKKVLGIWLKFSSVGIWGTFSEDGEDGLGYEYCFHLTNKLSSAPGVYHNDTDDQLADDYCPFVDSKLTTRWTDNATGTDAVNDVEYCILRKKINGLWESFNTPGIWSMFGQDGEDGSGYEYCFAAMPSTQTAPGVYHKDGEDQLADDYLPYIDKLFTKKWTDDPVGTDIVNDVEYVIMRRKLGGSWGVFGSPSIWGMYGHDGQDGKGYENIFNNKENDTLPTIPTYSSTGDYLQDDYVGPAQLGWTDNPVTPTKLKPFTFVSKRVKTNGEWKEFSSPTIWSRYVEDGKPGEPGAPGLPGTNGIDGLGYEYCFTKRPKSNQPPGIYHKPGENLQADDYCPFADEGFTIRYTDDASGPDKINDIEYCIMRKKVAGVWLPFSTPVTWSIFSKDGENGAPGDNGADGPSILFYGEYSTTLIYSISNSTRMVVYTLSGETKTYYLTKTVKEGAPSGSFSNIPVTNSTYWKTFDYSFKSIATEVLAAEYANIAGWVFKNNKLISQSGKVNGVQSSDYKNPSFVPNITLDGVSGEANLSNTTVSGKIYSNDMYVEGSYRRKTLAVEVDRGLGGVVLDGVPTTLENKTLPIGDNDVYVFLRRDCYDLINTFEFVEPIGELADKYDGATILIMIENSGAGDFVYLFKTKDSNGTLRTVNWFQVGYRLPTLSFCIMQFKFIKWRLDYPVENHSGWYVTQFTPIKF